MTSLQLAQRNLDFLTTSYNYLTWVLPIVVVAPEYFNGNVELGVISQASSAFGHILDDLSIVVNSFTDVSKFSAGIDRLYSFLTAIIALDPTRRRSMGSLLSVPVSDDNIITTRPKDEQMMSPKDIIQINEFDSLLSSTTTSVSQPSVILAINQLCLATPDNKRMLVEDLNLSLLSGNNLLIVGASGSGKSSLLRAIAGLWNTGSGSISRPTSECVYFLP